MKKGILYIFFLFSTTLLLFEWLTPFYINYSMVLDIIIFIFLSTSGIILGYFLLNLKSIRFILATLLLSGVFSFLKHFLVWRSDWKTQTILYQNIHQDKRTIDFQMDNMDTRDIDRRIIDRLRICRFIDWIEKVDETHIDTLIWKKVDIDVNELGLKGG
jgi:hypothetical protein